MAENAEVLALRRRARRRLVGAAALVLFFVIVPPMLMDLEPKPSGSNLSVTIPKQDSKFTPTPPPPAATTAPPAGVDAAPSPAAKATPPAVESVPPPPSGIPKTAGVTGGSAVVPAPAPVPAKPAAAPEADTYFVQLGVFANRQRADEIRARAAKEGFKIMAERVKVDAGEQTRLRAGPYASKAAAEQARERLEGLGKELKFQPGPVRATERRS